MTRSTAVPFLGLVLMTLAPAAASAQRLLETDGIELRGAARVVEYGAGTCNVSEERETAASYEQKRGNHGLPVDVWQLDFSVYNGSGRALDHLIANYRVAAENPPCTNWSWPEAGRYAGPIEWGDLAGFIQRSGGGNPTQPGETLTDTKYIFVFHEHQPSFDTWSVDYNFAAAAPAAGAESTVPAGGTAPRAQPGNERLEEPDAAVGGVPEIATPPSIGLETCAGQPVGSACWMEVSNHPSCHLWNPSLHAGATVAWSGECIGGYAQGTGAVRWHYDGGVQTEEGAFLDGKQHGTWVVQEPDGDVAEGLYVNGQRQGTWAWWFTNGNVLESPYLNGAENGQEIECARSPGDIIAWMISYADGDEIDRATIGPRDPDAQAARVRCSVLLSRPRPRP